MLLVTTSRSEITRANRGKRHVRLATKRATFAKRINRFWLRCPGRKVINIIQTLQMMLFSTLEVICAYETNTIDEIAIIRQRLIIIANAIAAIAILFMITRTTATATFAQRILTARVIAIVEINRGRQQ